jgi:hypothetical protein
MSKVLRRLFHRHNGPEAAEREHVRSDVSPTLRLKPAEPTSDEETVELQIAALISAWDKTSLCARREFLTRIDQRIMTTHWIRSARGNRAGDRGATSI